MTIVYLCLLINFIVVFETHIITASKNLDEIDLPPSFLPYYISSYKISYPFLKGIYANITPLCWGYEDDCTNENRFSTPRCPGDHRGWVSSKKNQIETFYSQADFGYVATQRAELKMMCEPTFKADSSLQCSDHMRYCYGRNILFNFTKLIKRDDPIRYHMDVLEMGDIAGHCSLNAQRLQKNLDHMSALQSWAPELRNFVQLPSYVDNNKCDVTIRRPVILMKLDASVNMYHHFCDFFNLYTSQHVNGSLFSKDVHIMIWETYNYWSNFGSMWSIFTQHPLWNLNTFRGKTVCFQNIMFPLLPRMIFGLYYNTPLIYGCEGSGLFRAFSEHVLHRLRINTNNRISNRSRLRVTLISRDTKYRRILNEPEILSKLRKSKQNFDVQRVVFNKEVPFEKQLYIVHNTDILIGMHGAGLTHLLFLPNWAAVFEVYNCEDANCYSDLARLRGVKYITWEDATKLKVFDEGNYNGGAHAKFVNYEFYAEEFARLLDKAAVHVRHHPEYKTFLSSTLRDEL